MSTEITFEPNLLAEDKEFLVDGLLDHLVKEANLSVEQIRSKPFAFVVRKDGKLHAGLTCEIKYHSVFMDLLWVDQSLRRQRIGSSLLAKAEEHAVNQGCTMAFLHTLSPDYIKFYESAGYTLEYSRPGYWVSVLCIILESSWHEVRILKRKYETDKHLESPASDKPMLLQVMTPSQLEFDSSVSLFQAARG